MNLMKLKFRDFTWPDNPAELKVTYGNHVREIPRLYGQSRTENLGSYKRKIKGRGFFTGTDCMAVFEALQEAFSAGTGFLQLPGQKPFQAVMDELVLLRAEGENLLEYSFSFAECAAEEKQAAGTVCTAKAGESLWDYAYLYGCEIEALIARNPHIPYIGSLREGERVMLQCIPQ